MTPRPPVRGVILAGGQASRFGGAPKGLHEVGGIRILDRLVECFITAFGSPPLLIANAPDASQWRPGLEVVADERPDMGALGGIYTALIAGPAPVVIAGWDMPFVQPDLLIRLAEGLSDFDACLPSGGGRWGIEPLLAGYGPGCLDPVRACLDSGDLRAVAFHDRIRLSILTPAEVARYGDPARLFFNVNTAADLDQAESLWRTPESSP